MTSKVVLLLLLFTFCYASSKEDASQTTTPAKLTTTNPQYPCNNSFLFVIETSTKLNAFAFQRQLNFLANYTFEKWNSYFDHLQFLETGSLDDIISNNNAVAFVPLSDQFNQTVSKHYFKQAKIIEWNITEETPDDWEEQFDDFYNCGTLKTTTIRPTEPTVQYPLCNSKVLIAFDKSNGLSEKDYQLQQSFLISHVFQNWTNFGNLSVYSFSDHVYSSVVPFKNVDELTEFVQSEEQIDSNPDLCNSFYQLFSLHMQDIVIFLSTIDGIDFNIKRQEWYYSTCQGVIDDHRSYHLTFVILNDSLNTDTLRQHIPQAQFIKLNLSDAPNNWEWSFLTAYGCNQDDTTDQITYPCNSKFIFGYEVSSAMDQHALNAQKNFLINDVFNSTWNIFDNLALIAYSNDTHLQDFGTLKNTDDIHSFIDNSFKQQNAPTSLCSVFKDLTTMQLLNVNIILFINKFGIDECPVWIKQLRENINFIHFIVLSKQVNVEYLLLHFSQAKFTYWNTKEGAPPNLNVESYGCQDFVINVTDYPCKPKYGNIIVYDRSHYLTPLEYQRLTNFLLARVFIKQWTRPSSIYTYPDDNNSRGLGFTSLELFVRQSLRINKEPLICQTISSVSINSNSNYLFFVSKFDETIFASNVNCGGLVNYINNGVSNVTFVVLTPRVNKTFLVEMFPNVTVIDWNIEQDEQFVNWTQVLWGSFGCDGESPIILPATTSTSTSALTTTPTRTSTTNQITSTKMSSSKQPTPKMTSTISTTHSTAHTTTTQSPPSNTPSPLIIVVSVLAPMFLISLCFFAAFVYFFRLRNRSQLVNNMVFNASNRNEYDVTKREEEEEIDLWEIETSNIQVFTDRQLGSGASANVYLGKLLGDSGIKRVYPDVIALRQFSNCEVAVKVLPFFATELNKEDFKQELNFMKELKYHSNVICLLGYTSEKIVLEYCANGDLIHFLKKNKNTFNADCEESLKLKDLIGFAWQIANGMDYFSTLGLLHRDLAARNILLTKENICKISDFGLARTNDVQSYMSTRRLPIRWLPPEVLKSSEYSTKTDVWSYAILLYEIFTVGCFPYSKLENTEILSFIESGNRLEQPEHASSEIYTLMLSCWSEIIDERPTFTQICQQVIPMLEQFNINYNYVSPTEAEINEINTLEESD